MILSLLSKKIQSWYSVNKRDLPWRDTKDPYTIWLSEIILQQTQVVQGLPYFEKFIECFPDATALANADESEIMRLWQGLGYYSRARNLHTTAKEIRDRYGGQFPTSYEDIRALKGVGDYTAAAVASFSYGMPYAVVDGNVIRVISRLIGLEYAVDSKEGLNLIKESASKMIDEGRPDMHNQAIMELGALVCKKSNPLCLSCPIVENCKSYKLELTQSIPFKGKKVKVQERHMLYFVISSNNGLLMKRRNGSDIWRNLYDFPSLEVLSRITDEKILATKVLEELMNKDYTLLGMSTWVKHQLTHRRIWAKFVVLQSTDSKIPQHLVKDDVAQYYTIAEVEQLGKPILIVNFLKEKSKFNL